MEDKIIYAKYPFPALDMGNYEYTDMGPAYRPCDIGYCNGLLPDGRPFLAEHYYDVDERMDYLVVIITADEMMDLEEREFDITKEEHRRLLMRSCFHSVLQMELDDVEGILSGTEYQEEITKYLLQQGVIENGNLQCDCMYLAIDKDDNFIIVANYEVPDWKECKLQMIRYDGGGIC